MTNQEFTQAVAALEAGIKDRAVAEVAPQNVSAEICKIYKLVKPVLTAALPFIRLIPMFGSQLADGLTLLSKLLDTLCPGN